MGEGVLECVAGGSEGYRRNEAEAGCVTGVSWGAGEAEKLHESSKGRMGQGGD